jgi:hypothetical protein
MFVLLRTGNVVRDDMMMCAVLYNAQDGMAFSNRTLD